jgi:hypothetical protein
MDSVAKMAGGHAEIGEGLGDHGGIDDRGDDHQGAAAVRAVFDVEIEYAAAAGPNSGGPAPRDGVFQRGPLMVR